MARTTRKSVIREYVQRTRPVLFGNAEAEAVRRELAAALGERATISNDYLLGILDELGVPATRELRGIAPEIYALLHFATLETAESTLRALDEGYRCALAAGDRDLAADYRRGAVLVRSRAERIARNQRVAPAKRAEKEEVARWFAIWLQTPDVFFDWLEVRKQTEEFQRLNEGLRLEA